MRAEFARMSTREKVRLSAIPTPNWKNAIPITAMIVKDAMIPLASTVVSASPAPRKIRIKLGTASVPTT